MIAYFYRGEKYARAYRLYFAAFLAQCGAKNANRNVEGFQSTIVVRLLKLTLVVAKEHYLLAEARDVLCRDESPYGLAFFENKFI